MSRDNWAADYANDLELCVYIGKRWAILKDGTNQKGLYKKISVNDPKYIKNPQQFSIFNEEIYENICDLPSLYYHGNEFEGGVVFYADMPKSKVYFLLGNNDKVPIRIENQDLRMEIEENLIVFYNQDNEEHSIYDTYSFEEISKRKDGQMGFNF